MKEFEITLQFATYATVFIQAENQEQAEDIALSHETLSGIPVECGEWEIMNVDQYEVKA